MEPQKIKGEELQKETIERMTRLRKLLNEKTPEIMNLTGVDGMVVLAYDKKTGIHIFPTETVSDEVAADMICQTAHALLNGPQKQ